jgi:hypothetical protein
MKQFLFVSDLIVFPIKQTNGVAMLYVLQCSGFYLGSLEKAFDVKMEVEICCDGNDKGFYIENETASFDGSFLRRLKF